MTKFRRSAPGRRAAMAALLAVSGILLVPCAFAARPLRDGAHDFDWEIGAWNTRLRVLRHEPNGTATWVTYEGTSRVVPIWNCRADLVELDATGPGHRHIQAINLRLYDPQSRQWSLNFANLRSGVLSVPTIGGFRHGVGTFYDQEPIEGREVLVRNVWSRITKHSAHFVQSISDDGGRTWHPNWIADDTRVKGTTDECEKVRSRPRTAPRPSRAGSTAGG